MFLKKKPTSSSKLAEFFLHASSREKKRVYMRALKEATDEQAAILAAAETAKVSST